MKPIAYLKSIIFNLRLIWHNWRYSRMWDKEQWANWATVANMPLSKKELKRAARRGIVETRQLVEHGRPTTQYRFNRGVLGEYYVKGSLIKTALKRG
jgi:hypothetical protein